MNLRVSAVGTAAKPRMFNGLAVVEEPTSATVLAMGDRMRVGTYGELRLEVAEE